jgi:hypothetical protein
MNASAGPRRVCWYLRRTPISGTRTVDGVTDLEPPQELCPAERKQLAVEAANRLVQVGHRDHERRTLAVDLGDPDQAGIDQQAQIAARARGIRPR